MPSTRLPVSLNPEHSRQALFLVLPALALSMLSTTAHPDEALATQPSQQGLTVVMAFLALGIMLAASIVLYRQRHWLRHPRTSADSGEELREAHDKLETALRSQERQFRLIVENANDVIYTVNAEGILTYVSPTWTEALGHDPVEVVGQSFEPFVHPEDVSACRQFLDAVINSGRRQAGVEYRVRHSNGELRWHTSNAAPLYDELSGTTTYLGIARDITERKNREREVQYQHRFQQLIVRLSSRFVDFGYGNMDPQIESVLREIGEFFGVDRSYLFRFSPDNTTMTNTHEWCASGVTPLIRTMQNVPLAGLQWWWQRMSDMVNDDRVLFINDVDALPEEAEAERALLQSQKVRSMFCVPVRSNQKVVGFFGVDSLTLRDWRDDQVDMLTVIANLISGALEKNRLEQEVINMSVTDPLTELRNRRYLESRLNESMEAHLRHGTDFTVALLDLDHFKAINDTHGHLIGDNILRQFAALLEESIRGSDLAARFGGEEFMILFPDTDLDEARGSVERILSRTRTMKADEHLQHLTVTVSAGLACVSELDPSRLSEQKLINLADTRLYRAKQQGRDRAVYQS